MSVVVWRRTVESAAVGYGVMVVAAFLLDADWQAVAAAFALVVAVGVRALIVERPWRGRDDSGG